MSDPMRKLDILVGRWELTVDHRAFGTDVRGVTTFVWHDGVFLEQSMVVDHPDFTNGLLIIGADDQTEMFSVCYADDRGTLRIYRMAVDGGVWRIWRDTPDYSQRFTGTFTADHDQIDGLWELSRDEGRTWAHDFRLTYRRIG